MKSDIIEASAIGAQIGSILDKGEFQFYSVTEHGIEFKKGIPQGIWLGVVE